MKSSILLCLMTYMALATCFPEPNSKYDNVDVEEIISNERLMKAHMRCFLNEGKCTADGLEMKKVIPDLSNDLCKSCTLSEKKKLSKVLKTAETKYPEDWAKLLNMYAEKSKIPEIERYISEYSS